MATPASGKSNVAAKANGRTDGGIPRAAANKATSKIGPSAGNANAHGEIDVKVLYQASSSDAGNTTANVGIAP